MVEAAQIHVVAAGVQTGVHRSQVDPVCGGVDEHLDPGQLLGEVAGGVRPAGLRLAAAVLHGHLLGAAQVEVEQPHRGYLVGLGQVADDRGSDRAAGSENRHAHQATSSFARSASQSSTRSLARLRSRPVSSSMRLIR